MSSYHQLTIGERELIFLDHELSFSIRRIAQLIKRSSSTISRELHRHTTTVGYRPSIAQKLYQQNKTRCGRHYRLANAKVKSLIGHLFLDLQWSPEEISKHLIFEYSTIHISYNTIYRAIYRGVFNDTELSHGSRGAIRKLRHRGKSRHTKAYGEHRGQIPVPHTIYERPLEAQQRSEIGHWEVDTVVGKSGGPYLVTMVDRKIRFLLTEKADHKRALSVNQAMEHLMNTLPEKAFKTLTLDRGSEFAKHAEITKDQQVQFYFPDAYASWQRGSNENINGLLREYLPKGQDLNQCSNQAIATFAQKSILGLVNV